jgi:hypothetical protein
MPDFRGSTAVWTSVLLDHFYFSGINCTPLKVNASIFNNNFSYSTDNKGGVKTELN